MKEDDFADAAAQQRDEILALQAIYGDDSIQVESHDPPIVYQLSIASESKKATLVVRITYPLAYPLARNAAPIYEIVRVVDDNAGIHDEGYYCPERTLDVSAEKREAIDARLRELVDQGIGVVMFDWIEGVKAELEEVWADPVEPIKVPVSEARTGISKYASEGASLQDKETPGLATQEFAECPEIVSGPEIVDRKSVFVGHVAVGVKDEEAVELVRMTLMRNNRISRATHNIMAFRIRQANGGVIQDFDDDGETAAGGRLLHLLQLLDAMDVVVVVSRWYGGIKLGPDRFKHINNAARKALVKAGCIASTSTDGKRTKKL